MAGAVSAGAYTAGVLDFFIEALDAWYAAKARGDLVPTHDVSLDVLSGASAGGMCAALAAVMLADPPDHIRNPLGAIPSARNRLFEAWVNRIDITHLLQTTDLPKHASPDVVSLLDSSVIDTIAAQLLTPTLPPTPPRPYVSPSLTLFLSLTNLRGVPYSLTGAAPGSVEETTFFYGDRICFQTRLSTDPPPTSATPAIHPLTLDQPGPAGGWSTLQDAAMATGAFPLFLRPRTLHRSAEEYTPPLWESVAPFQKPQPQPVSDAAKLEGAPPSIPPSFPLGMNSALDTLNVDGGITNNDPFTFAHDFLAALDPRQDPNAPNHDPLETDRAVISIAPFPTTTKFNAGYSAAANSGILRTLPSLVAALISQSRFFGESLNRVMDGTTFLRFVIAPADDDLTRQHSPTGPKSHQPEPPALQCASLGAFGGFFERGFRAHDFALGRQNCQTFLTKYFVLPAGNHRMRAALEALPDADRETILRDFRRPAPTTYATKPAPAAASPAGLPGPPPVPVAAALAADRADPYAGIWLPIIPLCRQPLPAGVPQLTDRLPPVPRQQISAPRLHQIVGLILRRFRTVTSVSLGLVTFWPLRAFLRPGPWFIALLARRPLTRRLRCLLGDAYKP